MALWVPATCELFPPVPATGKQSHLSAGTHDRLMELLAQQQQPQQQQPTMLQGSTGPLPAQLLALLLHQQRLQPGTTAAAAGQTMDATNTGAKKSQEDQALERLAAQLKQCRKSTAQQASAAK